MNTNPKIPTFSLILKRFAGKIPVFLILLVLLLNPGAIRLNACSTFFLQNGDQMVCGRNFDYSLFDYLIFVNKRNVVKSALQYRNELVDLPQVWTSKYGSITFNISGSELATDGINEEGLVVTALMLDDTEYPFFSASPSISVDQWVQFMLDNFKTVEEAIDACSEINIRNNPQEYWRLHIFVTDRFGNNAAIEFLNGELVVHTGENLEKNVLTNSTYDESIAYYHLAIISGGVLSSLNRYFIAVNMVDAYNHEDIYDYSYSILDAIAQSHTNKKIIYDITNMRVYLKTIRNTNLRYFDLSDFDFSCSEPVLVYKEGLSDIGDIRNNFIDYSTEINRSAITTFWNFQDREYTTEELDEVAAYPLSFDCFYVDAGEDKTICENFCQISGNSVKYYTGYWSDNSGNATFDDATNYNTFVRNLALGENILKWTLNGDLGSVFDEISIINNLETANAGIDQIVASGSAILLANNPVFGNGTWSVFEGTGIIENITGYNSTVSNLSQGSNVFVWEISNMDCLHQDTVEITYDINNWLVPQSGESGGILMYPNPVRELLNIRFQLKGKSGLKLTIINASGRIVFHTIKDNIQDGFILKTNVEGLPEGEYIVLLKLGSNKYNLKFIKY
jgi:choloylglycine hydrolase